MEEFGGITMPLYGNDRQVCVDYRLIMGGKVDSTFVAATAAPSHLHDNGAFARLHSIFCNGSAVVMNVPPAVVVSRIV